MSARTTFAGLSVSVPDGYLDRSSVVLVLQPAPSTDPRLKAPTVAPVNVVLSREPAAGRSASEILDEKLTELGKGLQGFKVQRRGEDTLPTGGLLPFCEYTAQVGPALVQMIALRPAGDDVVVLTGTAQAAVFAKHRAEMLAILADATPV